MKLGKSLIALTALGFFASSADAVIVVYDLSGSFGGYSVAPGYLPSGFTATLTYDTSKLPASYSNSTFGYFDNIGTIRYTTVLGTDTVSVGHSS